MPIVEDLTAVSYSGSLVVGLLVLEQRLLNVGREVFSETFRDPGVYSLESARRR